MKTVYSWYKNILKINKKVDDLRALQALEALIGRERTVSLIKEGWDGAFDFLHYPRTADYFIKLRERIAEVFTEKGENRKEK